MASRTKRVTITLPEALLDEIRAHSDNVSGFLAEAAKERLLRARYERAVARSFGGWQAREHVSLNDEEDIACYVEGLREAWGRDG